MNQMDRILYRMWVRAIKAAVARKDWKNAKIYKKELLRITKRYEYTTLFNLSPSELSLGLFHEVIK